jgi:hypothetical protein
MFFDEQTQTEGNFLRRGGGAEISHSDVGQRVNVVTNTATPHSSTTTTGTRSNLLEDHPVDQAGRISLRPWEFANVIQLLFNSSIVCTILRRTDK